LAYRRRGHANLYPTDGQLNLPVEKHSHGLRKWAAVEAARGSFDDLVEAIERATGVRLGKRQVEELANRAAVDVDDFYAQRRVLAGAKRDVLVLSVDGKGIVMHPEVLRPATAHAAGGATKLSTRLSKGEKRNRNAWPRSALSTTPNPSYAPPPTSSPAPTTPTTTVVTTPQTLVTPILRRRSQ
jgi:hypothetical protein